MKNFRGLISSSITGLVLLVSSAHGQVTGANVPEQNATAVLVSSICSSMMRCICGIRRCRIKRWDSGSIPTPAMSRWMAHFFITI